MLNKADLSLVKIRLNNISKKGTRSIQFTPVDVAIKYPDFYFSSTIMCLEDPEKNYPLDPSNIRLSDELNIFGYDESTQHFLALEGQLFFCSNAIIKVGDKYEFSLSVLPHFITSMKKYLNNPEEEIVYAENAGEVKTLIMQHAKQEIILKNIEPRSLIMIDGPLVGGNVSDKAVRLDVEMRSNDCIPMYFVKNSDSRLVVNAIPKLSADFNSDFHWASRKLSPNQRTAFFKYTDEHNASNSKVFCYIKVLKGFTQRLEMHTDTFEKYKSLLSSILDLISYYYLVQGDSQNPQVRPIAIAEIYAREGLKVLNIPELLKRLGFQPIINQVRFG